MNTVVLRQAVQCLHEKYGSELTEIAALVFTTRRLMACAGQKHNMNPEGMLKTLDKVVESHLIDRDLHPLHLRAAMDDLERDLACVTPS